MRVASCTESLAVASINGLFAGCGKSTQVPQFLLEEAIAQGNGAACSIICTQPRRVSATSLATRVAQVIIRVCAMHTFLGYACMTALEGMQQQGSPPPSLPAIICSRASVASTLDVTSKGLTLLLNFLVTSGFMCQFRSVSDLTRSNPFAAPKSRSTAIAKHCRQTQAWCMPLSRSSRLLLGCSLLHKGCPEVPFIKLLCGVQERGGRAGGQVGYSVRLDTRASASTQVLFCTTGDRILLAMICLLAQSLPKVPGLCAATSLDFLQFSVLPRTFCVLSSLLNTIIESWAGQAQHLPSNC